MSSKRGSKNKHLAPPSQDFFALGGNPASSTSQPGLAKLPLKRNESFQQPMSMSPKRPKLNSPLPQAGSMPTAQSFTSIAQVSNSVLSTNRNWEERSIVIPALELPGKILQYDAESESEEMIERILCGAAKQLREQKGKPDRCLAGALIYLAKIRPLFFCSNIILDAFSSLLKRDSINQKTKFNLVPSLVINLFHYAYHDENSWPEKFIKLFVEDSLGDRIWVDSEECKEFVNIIIASFKTKLPPKSLLQTSDVLNHSSSPSLTISNISEDSLGDEGSCSSNPSMFSDQSRDSFNPIVSRYSDNENFVTNYITEVMNDQINRRQNANDIPRNTLKLLTATAGIRNVRLMVAQKLEVWFQNPKLSRPAQDLLLTVCMNCTEQDTDTLGYLMKIRLKNKSFVNHFITCLKELLNQKNGTFDIVLRTVLSNELSQIRHMNNFQLVYIIFQHDPIQATIVLSQFFLSMIFQRDDYLRALRILLREVVRGLRFEHINFKLFVETLLKESKSFSEKVEFFNLDLLIKQRAFTSIVDLITMTLLLSLNPSVREAFSTSKPDRKDILRNFQIKIATMQSITVEWFKDDIARKFCVNRDDFELCLRKVLFLELPEQYCRIDNWPPENDRSFMFRLTSEVPLFETTLMGILTMGLKKEITPKDSCEFCCALINRAASIYDGDSNCPVLMFSDVSILLHLFESSAYYYPDNVMFPETYKPQKFAIIDLYWKVWLQILIIATHIPNPFGEFAWERFPTFRMLIEMAITNNYQFPLKSLGDDYSSTESHCNQVDIVKILELENYLASNQEITESNSYLIPTLISLDPFSPPRRPPNQFLEQLRSLCNSPSHRLCHYLCQSRKPDFLLMIIDQQQRCLGLQTIASPMTWLVELVESHENNYGILPVQCLCEFLLGQIAEELSNPGQQELSKNDLLKKKEKRRKLIRLINHLQNIELTCDSSCLSDAFNYLFCRLSYPQSITRLLAYKSIQLIVSTNVEEYLKKMDENNNPPLLVDDSDDWFKLNLVKYLKSKQQIEAVYFSLNNALNFESDHVMLCNYLEFIAQHVQIPSIPLISNISSLLLCHKKIAHFILNYTDLTLKTRFLSSYYQIYYKHLNCLLANKAQMSEGQVCIKFTSQNKSCPIKPTTVHGIIFVLSYNVFIDTQSQHYKFLSNLFLRKPYPQLYTDLDMKKQEPIISEWNIMFRLLTTGSEEVIDLVLDNIKTEQIIMLLDQYGLSVLAVQKLLIQLDKLSAAETRALKTLQFNRNNILETVQVYWNKGITSGYKFAKAHLNYKAVVSNEVSDVEMSSVSTVKMPDDKLFQDVKNVLFKKEDLIKLFNEKDPMRMRQLSRLIITELNNPLVKTKKLTKLFLTEFNTYLSNIENTWVGHFFDSIFNLIVVVSLKDSKRFGFNSDFVSIKKSLSAIDLPNISVEDTTLYKCVERFFNKDSQKGKKSKIQKKKSNSLKTMDDLKSFIKSLSPNNKTFSRPWLEIFKDLAIERFYNKDSEHQLYGPDLKLMIFSRNRPYFLSLLIHKSNISTIKSCIEYVLSDESKHNILNSTAVLDFLSICVSLLQRVGCDSESQKVVRYKDVLKLTQEQIQTLIGYVILENNIADRMNLLFRSCCCTSLKTKLVINMLNNSQNGTDSKIVLEILTRIYVCMPSTNISLNPLNVDKKLIFSLPSSMDKITHNMITSLMDVGQIGSLSKQTFTFLELSLLKIASKHPLLLIRVLPLVPAMLAGKAYSSSYGLFKNHNVPSILRLIISLLNQLRPYIWDRNIRILDELLTMFLRIFANFCQLPNQSEGNKEILPLIWLLSDFYIDWANFDDEYANNWYKNNRSYINQIVDAYGNENIFNAITPAQQQAKRLELIKNSHNYSVKLRAVHYNQETLFSTLSEISKLSDVSPELAEILLDEIRALYTTPSVTELALNITLKALKHNPSRSSAVIPSYLRCLDSDDGFITKSALNLLPQFVLLSQEHRYLILKKTFDLAVLGNVTALPVLIETLKALTLQKGC